MATSTLEFTGMTDSVDSIAPARPFARVDVFKDATSVDAASVADPWRELEGCAPCSVYQTRAFVLPWADTLGRMAGLEPCYLLARDAAGRATALLALGLARRGPLRVATWLGGKDANFNMALLRQPSAWSRADLLALLRAAGRASGAHVFALPNQPFSWAGIANPFAQITHDASPSAAYGTALPATGEALFAAKISKESRKKLRKKENKLASFGPVAYGVVTNAEEQAATIDTFLAQKTARFRERGIVSDFDAPEMRAFIEKASAPNGTGIDLHTLRCGERIVAIYGGAAHGGQWSGMFNSFDADEEISKASPGDLLLMRIVDACCAAGLTSFDLGIGEARYKEAFCDEAIPLFDVFEPVSLRGHAYVATARLRQRAKRRLKSDPRLLGYAMRLRAALRRTPREG